MIRQSDRALIPAGVVDAGVEPELRASARLKRDLQPAEHPNTTRVPVGLSTITTPQFEQPTTSPAVR